MSKPRDEEPREPHPYGKAEVAFVLAIVFGCIGTLMPLFTLRRWTDLASFSALMMVFGTIGFIAIGRLLKRRSPGNPQDDPS